MDWVKQLFTKQKAVYDSVSKKLKTDSTINFFCQVDMLYKTVRPNNISNVRN